MERRRDTVDEINDPGIPGTDNRWYPNQGQARRAALAAATRRGQGFSIAHDPRPARGQPHYHVISRATGRRVSGHFFYGRRPPRREYRGRPWREFEHEYGARSMDRGEAELEYVLRQIDRVANEAEAMALPRVGRALRET